MACTGSVFFLLWCCSHVRPLNHVAESLQVVVSIGAQSGECANLPHGFYEKWVLPLSGLVLWSYGWVWGCLEPGSFTRALAFSSAQSGVAIVHSRQGKQRTQRLKIRSFLPGPKDEMCRVG